MDRRRFIGRTTASVAAGTLLGPQMLANEAEKRLPLEKQAKRILN